MDGITSSRKLQRHNVGGRKDMISELPEGVLLYILSFLRTKDAARTSVLSTKWRYLWSHLSVIDFELCCNPYLSKAEQKSANCVIDQVEKLLRKFNRVERLNIEIQGAVVDTRKVYLFLSSALMHKVLDLKLSLRYINDKIVLPNSFSAYRALTKLHLEFGIPVLIPDGMRFLSLKTLYLSRLIFANENSAQQLLSGCPVLQELSLYKCYWTKIKQISVAISTLRKLTIDLQSFGGGYDDSSFTVKIDAVNLLSLSYTINEDIKCVLVNPTSIVDANIDLRYFYSQIQQLHASQCAIELLSRLVSVKSLTLSNFTLQVCLAFNLSYSFFKMLYKIMF
jgi:hypothetical protein